MEADFVKANAPATSRTRKAAQKSAATDVAPVKADVAEKGGEE